MPGLGHDVREFQVFHWRLHGSKQLGEEVTSPGLDYGGHQWYVLPGSYRLSHLRDLKKPTQADASLPVRQS